MAPVALSRRRSIAALNVAGPSEPRFSHTLSMNSPSISPSGHLAPMTPIAPGGAVSHASADAPSPLNARFDPFSEATHPVLSRTWTAPSASHQLAAMYLVDPRRLFSELESDFRRSRPIFAADRWRHYSSEPACQLLRQRIDAPESTRRLVFKEKAWVWLSDIARKIARDGIDQTGVMLSTSCHALAVKMERQVDDSGVPRFNLFIYNPSMSVGDWQIELVTIDQLLGFRAPLISDFLGEGRRSRWSPCSSPGIFMVSRPYSSFCKRRLPTSCRTTT